MEEAKNVNEPEAENTKKPRKPRSPNKPKGEMKFLGVSQLLKQKPALFDLSVKYPELYQAFGKVQYRGVWFIWGGSGSGKSSLLMDICKAFADSGELKVLHNELEEEIDDHDFLERLRLKDMDKLKKKYMAGSYSYDKLTAYLEKTSLTFCILINSATYFFPNLEAYYLFTKRFKRKHVIIITGMAEGKRPATEMEKRIMYDANKKIFVDGYLASCKGRTIGPNGGNYIIWQEGYEKLHGVQPENKNEDT